MLAFSGCEQLTENEASVSQLKLVADAEGLEAAFADPGITVIEIQGDITADTLKLTVPAGDKTIYITGGKETAIGSLELSAGSHVKIMNGSGGTAKSVGGALVAAYSEQDYDGWATLVIWNHFKIPEGATFDLTGKVRLVFRVAEIDGDLSAGLEDSLLGAGDSAPKITGKGNVQTSSDAGATTPELAAAAIKNSENHKTPPSVTITSAAAGAMDKGETRQFAANRTVTWTVEGGSKNGGTTISEDGLLTVGADETNITLTVKAASGEYNAAETVKVKGWKTITSAAEIFTDDNDANVYGISYGAGKWVAVGGAYATVFPRFPQIAYSTDGESWTEVTNLSPNNVSINDVVYVGPEDNKKFIALAEGGVIYYSTDGVKWTGVTIVTGDDEFKFNGAAYGNGMFIAVGNSTTQQKKVGGVATSTDGISWTWQGIPENLTDVKNVTSIGGRQITFHNGKFMVAFGVNSAIATTTNGTDMDLVAYQKLGTGFRDNTAKGYPSSYTSTWRREKMIFANGQWIAAGPGATVMVASENSTSTWTPITVGTKANDNNNKFSALAEGGGKVVIAGEYSDSPHSRIHYAATPLTESTKWTSIADARFADWYVFAIAYGDNKFIAAGLSGVMAMMHEETLE
jgi:hypothetical protein